MVYTFVLMLVQIFAPLRVLQRGVSRVMFSETLLQMGPGSSIQF